MSYKSIHFPATGTDDDADAMTSAVELAALHGARLTVVSAFMPPALQMAYVVPPNLYLDPSLIENLQQAYEATREGVRTHAQASAARAGLAFGRDVVVVEYEMTAWESVPLWAPLSDLVVVGPQQARREVTADLLLKARAPVLIARPELRLKPMTAAIAWDGGFCAGRAVRAAMPLLATAKRTIILQQASGLSETRRKAGELNRLADYLGLHGQEVVIEPITVEGDTGEAIIDAAHCCDADVLVCGAYGHSRLSETVLGGVTRTVLNAAFPSTLLAH